MVLKRSTASETRGALPHPKHPLRPWILTIDLILKVAKKLGNTFEREQTPRDPERLPHRNTGWMEDSATKKILEKGNV